MRYNLKQNERFKLKEVRPRQESNLESCDPKSDALSIRPRGQDNIRVILMPEMMLLMLDHLWYRYPLFNQWFFNFTLK